AVSLASTATWMVPGYAVSLSGGTPASAALAQATPALLPAIQTVMTIAMRMDDDELERSDEVDMWRFGYKKNVLADANTTAQPLPLGLPHGANRSPIVARAARGLGAGAGWLRAAGGPPAREASCDTLRIGLIEEFRGLKKLSVDEP